MFKSKKLLILPILCSLTMGFGALSISANSNPFFKAINALNKKIDNQYKENSNSFLASLDFSDKEIINNIYKTIKDVPIKYIGITSSSSGQDICKNLGYSKEDITWNTNFLNYTGWNSKISFDSKNIKEKCIYKV